MHPEIILGPPGTGKTTTLLNLVEEEMEKVAPDRIGYISFTKKAASEAAERAQKRFNLTASQLPYFRTIHSLCFWALGMTPGDVLERSRLLEFGKWAGIRVTGHFSMEEGSSFGFEQGDRILFMENLARVRCRSLRDQFDEDCDNLHWYEVDRVSRALAEYKKGKHLVDYTDMLSLAVASDTWVPKLDVLFVDEAQDLSKLQWKVVEKLARHVKRLVIAGDDDQAIYRWAGADIEHFVGMPGQVRVLDHSWRCPQEVQSIAAKIIGRVHNRRPKTWHPREGQGILDRAGGVDGVDLTGSDILVLARNNFILREQVAPILRSSGVIFEHRGTSSVRRSTLEAIVSWERLRKGETIPVQEALNVYESMSSGTSVARGYKKLPGFTTSSEVNLQELQTRGGLRTDAIWHEALDRIPTEERVYLLRALRSGEKLTNKPRIRLSTIHGAKGGQADHVVLIRDMAWRTFQEMGKSPEDEARVWYVAATRAKDKLTITQPRTKLNFVL